MATRHDKTGREAVAAEDLAEAISAAMPALDVTGQRIGVAIHRLMSDGEPVTAEHGGTTLLSVHEAFEVGRALTERVAPDLFAEESGPPSSADRTEARR